MDGYRLALMSGEDAKTQARNHTGPGDPGGWPPRDENSRMDERRLGGQKRKRLVMGWAEGGGGDAAQRLRREAVPGARTAWCKRRASFWGTSSLICPLDPQLGILGKSLVHGVDMRFIHPG